MPLHLSLRRIRERGSATAWARLGLIASLALAPAGLRASVVFDNCVTAADGSISCDTAPTGNTAMNDVAARYGLFQNASPGWNEFSPYQGYDEELGDGED